MAVTISQYIEAVQNPNGRFRTLAGIYPVTDESDEPLMTTGDICANFEVIFEGKPYILKCLLSASTKHKEHLESVSLFTQLIQTPFLVPHKYLEDELTVFDASEKACTVDTILCQKPDGTPLNRILEQAASMNDSSTIWNTGKMLPKMAAWMWDNEFSAGSLSTKTLFIRSGNIPVMTDYTYARRKRSLTDIRAICSLEAALYCCACEPRLYKTFLEEHLTSRNKLISLAADLNVRLGDEQTSTLIGLLALLSTECANYDEYVAYLLELASKLASEEPTRITSLSDMADDITNESDPNPQKPKTDFTAGKYTYVGEPNCNLMRAFDGEKWCYIDKTGKTAISGNFIDASDFEEDRAVVETPEGFGLIDTNGKFILPPSFDDLDWDSYNNIAIATKDGKSGIFSRSGEQLSPLCYDQILNCSEGLIPARKNGMYGYLGKDGSVAIDFKFDDVFSFRDGVARVKHSGHEILIDADGNEIDRIIK